MSAESPSGLLLVDKPSGVTSHDVVASVRRALGTRKVGHAGTLDPMATGLLLVGVGRATRLLRFLGDLPKTYEGTGVLGVETDTLDAEGAVVREAPVSTSLGALAVAMASFTGVIQQRPPAYSAVKVGGQKLYVAARAGRVVEAAPRRVTVEAFDLEAFDPPRFDFRATVSSGTYVRSLVADVGTRLGTGAHLARLRRMAIGPFLVAEATPPEHPGPPLPMERAVAHLPGITLHEEEAKVAVHGCCLGPAGIEGSYRAVAPDGRLIGVYRDEGAKAVPEVILAPRLMELATGLESLAGEAEPSVVTIGFFDGVHRGHQAVFARTVEVAMERGLRPVAVTFDRHPREVLTPGHAPPLITTLERKAELIAGLGIATLAVLPFDQEFSRWSPEDFVRRVLVQGLRTRHVVVGSNFTFGHKAQGTLATLVERGADEGFTAEGVSLLLVEGRPVSSSSIREAVAGGELSWPRQALGRRFTLDGRVTTGAGRGRTLGFPTANLEVPPRLLVPGQGVYAGRAVVPPGAYTAAVNVGTNPTFGREPLHVEAFLLDFDGDLRGEPIAVEFWERLRDEERFPSPEALARQISDDVERTRRLVR